MPNARQIFDLLTRDELLRLVDQHSIAVTDRRQKAHLVERLEQKGHALSELLADFSRDRLKEFCRALGLDDSGKEKAALVARIAGTTSNADAAPKAGGSTTTRTKAAGSKANGGAVDPVEIPVGATLTIDALERYLWSAADILRGSIDSSDYKGFIFGL